MNSRGGGEGGSGQGGSGSCPATPSCLESTVSSPPNRLGPGMTDKKKSRVAGGGGLNRLISWEGKF